MKTYLQAYKEAQEREMREAAALQEAKQNKTLGAAAARLELKQLVEDVQRGKQLIKVAGKAVTPAAADLYRELQRDFDSAASNKELAKRLGVSESRIIGALAELVYFDLCGERSENGKRRLMVSVV